MSDTGRLVAGLQPVREAIRVHGARLTKVLVDDRDLPRLHAVARFAQDQGVARVERCPRRELDRIAGGSSHQGAVCYAPPLAMVSAEALLARPALLACALDGIQDPQNFGAVIRSAVGVAGAAVVWGEHGAAPLSPATFRASAGAVEHAELCRVSSLPSFLEQAAGAGAMVLALDAQAEQSLADTELSESVVVVIGSEDKGLHRAVRRACTARARLVRTRSIDSLNASVAAAIALYDISLRRRISDT